jgi:hypothetical protein
MSTIVIPMIEVENCLICHKHIGKGNDPAICKQEYCKDCFYIEVEFNKFTNNEKEKSKNQKGILQSS